MTTKAKNRNGEFEPEDNQEEEGLTMMQRITRAARSGHNIDEYEDE